MAGILSNAGEVAVILTVGGVACYFLERVSPAEKNTPFFKKDFRKEISLALLNMLILIPIFTFLVTISLVAVMERFIPYQIFDEALTALPLMLQIIAGAFIMDFSTYWRHRFSHRYWWPYHAFHHSGEEITWLTSLRLHPVDVLFAVIFDTAVLYILGFDGMGIVGANILMLSYNFFTHLNMDYKFPKPLCYILASPHYHRWHHATDKSAYDKNFCGMFSLLDVIFGTYHNPDVLPQAYGLSPNEQKEVPPTLFPHLILPIRKTFRKLIKR